MHHNLGRSCRALAAVGVVAVAFASAAAAQGRDSVRVMTLEQAVARAVQTDPAAIAAMGAETTAQAELRQSRASFLPSLSVNSSYSNSSNQRFDQASGQLVSENYSAQLAASYELFSGGRRFADQRGFPGARIFVRPPQIRGLRTFSSGADVALSVQGDDLKELQRLAGQELPEGYGILYGGEEQAIKDNNRQLTIEVLLSIFLVFVVMVVQYESVMDPLVILLAIPLSLVGVCVALFVSQTPLSAPSCWV